MRIEEEIIEELGNAVDVSSNGGKFHGMSYEEGVIAALEWVIEDVNESPMED